MEAARKTIHQSEPRSWRAAQMVRVRKTELMIDRTIAKGVKKVLDMVQYV